MPSLPRDTDILIVGAGPTGLALAAELRRLGIAALIVDKIAEGANTSRAAVVHARTLEVLEPLGVVPRMLAEGIKVPIFRLRDRDKTLVTVDFHDIPSTYNYTLMFPQNRTEAVLLARLRELGGDVVRPAEITHLAIGANGVEANISVAGIDQSVTSRWIVGCDGMHSTVRDAAGIGFAGEAYEQGFALGDVHMDWPLSREEVYLFMAPDGLVVVAPLPDDHFRLVATADDAPPDPSAAYLQGLMDSRGPQATRAKIRGVTWSSRFHVHHRVAETPRRGRVLLCGDAAHVHSPAGGQGMNTGIQDAVSLGGVLAAVAGGADDHALDAWAARRHEIAEGVVAMTDKATRMGMLRSPMGRVARNAMMGLIGKVPALQQALARRLSEIDNR